MSRARARARARACVCVYVSVSLSVFRSVPGRARALVPADLGDLEHVREASAYTLRTAAKCTPRVTLTQNVHPSTRLCTAEGVVIQRTVIIFTRIRKILLT